MFCALHAVAAFGVLLVVCSLAHANAVRLRVQLRPSPVQSSDPAARLHFPFLSLFLFSVAKPGIPRLFSPLLETAAVCMWSTLLSLSAAPVLEKSPPGFSPPFYSFPCSPALQT